MNEANDIRQPESVAPVRSSELVRRRAFEAWITSAPYERSAARYPENELVSSWPGQYRDNTVQVAWEAWCESPNDQAHL
jgi:hypothetical protein